jgi:hypothetical protein
MCRGTRRASMCIGASHCAKMVRQSALARVDRGGRASAYADVRVVRHGASARVRLGVGLSVLGVLVRRGRVPCVQGLLRVRGVWWVARGRGRGWGYVRVAWHWNYYYCHCCCDQREKGNGGTVVAFAWRQMGRQMLAPGWRSGGARCDIKPGGPRGALRRTRGRGHGHPRGMQRRRRGGSV